MPEARSGTAARRRQLLGRTRAISIGIAGAASVASLGLGIEFAQAIPGHAAVHAAQAPASGHARAAPPAQAPAQVKAHEGRGRHRTRLTAPAQPPGSTSAPSQVTSGGS